MKQKKKVGAIVAIVIVLLILAVGGYIAYTMYANAMAEKEAVYTQAEAYLAEDNYRDAYRTYLQVEDYKDAAEKAANAQNLMADAAKVHMDKAQHLSDMKFNTIAGLYLTAVLANEKQFTLDDYNQMAELVGSYYELATQQYGDVQTIDNKDLMTLPVMEKLMPRIEALEDNTDPQEALSVMSEITTFSLADQVFLHCWNNGTFANTALDTMAEAVPDWIPVMDQIISATESLDVIALVNKS